jgi:hypothetical protein
LLLGVKEWPLFLSKSEAKGTRITISTTGETRQMLSVEIYGWFTEGFDTKDLQEAKALLEALA